MLDKKVATEVVLAIYRIGKLLDYSENRTYSREKLIADIETQLNEVVAAGLPDAPSDTNAYVRKGGAWEVISPAGFISWGDLNGNIEDQLDLNTTLNNKADTGHTHTVSEVTDLSTFFQTEIVSILDALSALDIDYTGGLGANVQAAIDALEAALTGKADSGHTHLVSDITDAGSLASLNEVGTTEITDNAVTNAKLSVMAAGTIKGRLSTSGIPQDLTVAQVLTLLGTDAAGTPRPPTAHTHTLVNITDAGALASKNTVGTAEIDNQAVTNAKLLDMPANTIKGSVAGGTPSDLTAAEVLAITNAVARFEIVDNLNSSSTDTPLSANQGRILQLQIAGLGDMKVVANDTERDALTGLTKGDMVHVENGGNWIRWQITSVTDGLWATSTKIIIATETVAGGTNLGYVPSTRTVTSDTGADAVLPLVVASGDAGLMSGTDKTKLDGIEAGATADMTPTEILTALLTVDGTGSGLDADRLDGLTSADFFRQFVTSLDAIDLNTVFAVGSYRVNSNCTNNPAATFASLIVVGNGTNVTSQRLTHFVTGESWIRSFNVSWSAWRRVYDNVNNVKEAKIILENPLATDDFLLLEPLRAVTITRVTYQVFGATNVSFNVNHSGGTDLWASDKVATTTKVSETVFTDATCTANNQIRYQASAITGTPSKIEVTVYYTED